LRWDVGFLMHFASVVPHRPAAGFAGPHTQIKQTVIRAPLMPGTLRIFKARLLQTPAQMFFVKTGSVPLTIRPHMKKSLGDPVHPVQIGIMLLLAMIVGTTSGLSGLEQDSKVGDVNFEAAAWGQYAINFTQRSDRPIPGNVLQHVGSEYEIERFIRERQLLLPPTTEMIDGGASLTIHGDPCAGQPLIRWTDFELTSH